MCTFWDPEKDLDYRKLSFPSNRLTIGGVRRRAIDPQGALRDEDWEDNPGLMVFAEQNFARNMAREVRGLPDEWDRTWEDHVEELNEKYVRYGLSSGMHQTGEMLRRIREEVVAQVPEECRSPQRPR